LEHTIVLQERVAVMSSEELAGVLAFNPEQYRSEFLELARDELEYRGLIFSDAGRFVTTPDGLVIAPRMPALPPPPYYGPSGIGGWLLIFILGNLACRPLAALVNGVGHSATSIARISEIFPTTALLFSVDKMLTTGLIASGVAVSLALLYKGSSLPVRLTKIFLAAYPLLCMVMVALYSYNDLPEDIRDTVVRGSMRQAVGAAAWSLIWLLYFNRSKRVKATYAADEQQP
jgi:hypothetical protein